MRRQKSQNQIHICKSWFQWLTATVLVTSVLQSFLPGKAQPVDNKVVPSAITNQATYTYTDSTNNTFQGTTSQIQANSGPLIDPLGRILGCGSEILPDYTGFSVGLYEPNPNDPTGTELGNLVPLTRTEVPDIPNNKVPIGKAPNIENANPYFIGNNPAGVYNFLFDSDKGQTNVGRTYILVINPPPNSIYRQRRIKIEIVGNTGGN
ncbi:hypothetical protein H6G26_40265, partial [Nostoc sp. FACHB-888]|nr:hypothetical protein [Nostoc sp. FACHB-888]